MQGEFKHGMTEFVTLIETLIASNTAVIAELKGLRADLKTTNTDTCSPADALAMLGLNNKGYLPYFVGKGLLNRRKGGKSFLYFKSECLALADKIRTETIVVPSVRELFNYKN